MSREKNDKDGGESSTRESSTKQSSTKQSSTRESSTKVTSTPKLESTRNPAGQLFNPRDLPRELVEGMDIKQEILDAAQIDPREVLMSWLQHRYPTIINRQDCEDVISAQSYKHDTSTFQEVQFGAKLALIAFSMPYFMQRITSHLHMKNNQFLKYLESFVAESTFLSYKNMDQIVQGETKMLDFPVDAQVCGFYVRTPIQIWDENKRQIFTIPRYEDRTNLLNYYVTGNVNVYVLRKNTVDGFECYVTFRGTSNEFNGIPQYGRKMNNTPVYRVPQYDPIENKFYDEGSTRIPLFYLHYCEMVTNAMPHILQCLEWLQARDELCKRIIVAGHSMGGAMTLAFCYLLKHRDESLWNKCQFRSYGAPLSCNDAAVRTMEQWVIDSMVPNKFIEVVNTDDFVNIQYLLGGKRGLKQSVKEGVNRVGSWLVSTYWDQHGPRGTDLEQRMLRIIQLYPEIALSAFLNGALQAQIENAPDQRNAPFRMGARQLESDLWGTRPLKETYNGTMKVFFCRRNIQWQSEYIGKSHSNYVDLNMNILWAPLRMYEDNLYKFYADHDLRVHNELRIVGMFNEVDSKEVSSLIDHYKPAPYFPVGLEVFRDVLKFDLREENPRSIVEYEKSRTAKFGTHSEKQHRLVKRQ